MILRIKEIKIFEQISVIITHTPIPIALFNVIPYRNVYRKKSYRLAKQIAEERGIPHMNFFAHLPNEVSYISERLRENIVKSL